MCQETRSAIHDTFLHECPKHNTGPVCKLWKVMKKVLNFRVNKRGMKQEKGGRGLVLDHQRMFIFLFYLHCLPLIIVGSADWCSPEVPHTVHRILPCRSGRAETTESGCRWSAFMPQNQLFLPPKSVFFTTKISFLPPKPHSMSPGQQWWQAHGQSPSPSEPLSLPLSAQEPPAK